PCLAWPQVKATEVAALKRIRHPATPAFAPLTKPNTCHRVFQHPTREELLKRAKYRFTSAHTANSWVAFFCSPRKRSFTNPNFSFITANTCSTFERTLDFVRFFARSTSSTPCL